MPSLVITIAENQKAIAEKLHDCGLVQWLGHYDIVSESFLIDELAAILKNGQNIRNWSLKCMSLIDGRDQQSDIFWLKLDKNTPMIVRLKSQRRGLVKFRWVNDPLVRKCI